MSINDNLKSAASHLVKVLQSKGYDAYFAGGAVRDMLLGREAHDVDIATSAPPDDVQKLFPKTTDLQGKSFGVVRILHNDIPFEIATFRNDGSYTDGRRPQSVTFSTAEDDAQRRDFTINGLFYDPIKDQVIDYVGGEKDLSSHIIRAIGDPEQRFQEDHLRLFRAIRFAAELDFQIEDQTWAAIKKLHPLSASLAAERVRDELVRCLTGNHPQRAFDLLVESGLFSVWIPEIEKMKGVEQPPQFHPEGDVYTHVRMMIGHLKNPSPALAFSVLFHDISKPETYTVDETGRIRFNEHDILGADKAEEIMKRLKFSNHDIQAVKECVRNHMAFKDTPHMRVSKLKRFLSRPFFETELELHRIDCLCSNGMLDIYGFLKEKKQNLPPEEIKPDPLVTGHDLIQLGMQSGKKLGALLNQLLDEQLEGNFKDREAALKRAKKLISEI